MEPAKNRTHADTTKRRLTLALALLGLLAAAVLPEEQPKEEAGVLDLLRSCEIAVRGKVEEVVAPGSERICTARIRIKEVLKGVTRENTLWAAEELFPSEPPSFHDGANVLLFLVPLPDYSRWKDYRAKGVEYTTAGGRQGVRELDAKGARQAAAFLIRYRELASFRTQEEKKRYLDSMLDGLDSRVDLVQEISVEGLVRLNDLRLLIGKREETRLDRFIRDRHGSRPARLRLIHTLLAWEGFEESVTRVLQDEPEMRLSILRDLNAFGAARRLAPGVLEACLRDPDPRVRTQAIALVPQVTDPAVGALLGEIARNDASAEVRARAVTAAVRRGGEPGRRILSQGLEDPSPLVVYTAADEMRRLGGEASARELGGLLQSRDSRARLIGVLMLGSMEEAGARSLLEDASRRNPDAKTREWCRTILDGKRLDLSSIHEALGLKDRPKIPGLPGMERRAVEPFEPTRSRDAVQSEMK